MPVKRARRARISFGSASISASTALPKVSTVQRIANRYRKKEIMSIRSVVQFPIPSEYPHFIECNPPLRLEIDRDTRPLRHAVVQRDYLRDFLFHSLHRLGKGVAQAFGDLKQRQVGVSEPRADQEFVAGRILRQHPLEI